MRIIVLGAAAGGGLPQWNCGCANCEAARDGNLAASTQFGLAVQARGAKDWVLICASPDLRFQVVRHPELAPVSGTRESPIGAVIVPGAEIDQVAGLLHLREGPVFPLFAPRAVLDELAASPIFDVLDRGRVVRMPLELDEEAAVCGLKVLAHPVPGKPSPAPDSARGVATTGTTAALCLRDDGGEAVAYVVPACARIDENLRERLRGAALVMFDGTLWTDTELIAMGLSHKTGREMGHVSLSGQDGPLARLGDLGIGRRVLVHLNNTNPVWRTDGDERRTVEKHGWEVAFDGMEIAL